MKIIRFIIIGLIFFNNAFSQTFEKTINDNLFNPVFTGRNIQVTANEDYLVAGKTEPVNGYNHFLKLKMKILFWHEPDHLDREIIIRG